MKIVFDGGTAYTDRTIILQSAPNSSKITLYEETKTTEQLIVDMSDPESMLQKMKSILPSNMFGARYEEYSQRLTLIIQSAGST